MTNFLPCPTHHRFNVPLLAAAAIPKFTFTDFAGNPAAAAAGGWGAVDYDVLAGDTCTVVTEGVAAVIAGAAGLVAGNLVESDANGHAVLHNAGVVRGRVHPSQKSASLVGQPIPIVLLPQLT